MRNCARDLIFEYIRPFRDETAVLVTNRRNDMYEDAYEDACERCRNRLEDCECEPGFPAAFDPDLFYSPEARADAKRRTILDAKLDGEVS